MVVLALLALLPAVAAEAVRTGDLRIETPWARATPPATPMGAAYLVIVNAGDRPDRLLGASSPVARRVQLHRTVTRDGQTGMRHQAAGIAVPAGGRVRFVPGGLHFMLMGLSRRLEPGSRVPLTLEFERAGRVTVELPVRPLASSPPAD